MNPTTHELAGQIAALTEKLVALEERVAFLEPPGGTPFTPKDGVHSPDRERPSVIGPPHAEQGA